MASRKSTKPKRSNKIRKGPAAPSRVSESPLTRLKRAGSLNVYEHTAADEIVAAYRMSIGEPVSRDDDLGVPIDNVRHDAADDAAARRSDIVTKYRQWRQDLHHTPALAAAQAILFRETPLRSVEQAHRWRNGSAREHLAVALRHFAALRGNIPRSARDWQRPASSVNT